VALRPLGLAPLLVCLASAARADPLADGNAAFDAGRYAEARHCWSAAAQAGDAQAAFDLGLLYDLGEGVTPSAETAFRWYRRAAAAGLATAAFNVAVMYDSGRGAPSDRAQAAVWYARAAAMGEARAAYNLGLLYEAGEGVPRNSAAAIAWYGVAAASIPEASLRARTLAPPHPAPSAGSLVPPVPAWPAPDSAVPLSATQLVWTAPVEPMPVIWFVELQALDNGHFKEVSATYVTTTAIAVTLPADAAFAWRVYAVAADGSAYVAGPWSRFAKGPMARDAG
jgi:tetratricopeptide (TPR) repeat protein